MADLPTAGRRKSKMFYVYAIKSRFRNYIYVGLSGNYQKRVEQHQNGKETTTRPYAPFEIILVEEFKTRSEAREREKYLKSGIGKEYIKSIR